jgi:hypothetical protein
VRFGLVRKRDSAPDDPLCASNLCIDHHHPWTREETTRHRYLGCLPGRLLLVALLLRATTTAVCCTLQVCISLGCRALPEARVACEPSAPGPPFSLEANGRAKNIRACVSTLLSRLRDSSKCCSSIHSFTSADQLLYSPSSPLLPSYDTRVRRGATPSTANRPSPLAGLHIYHHHLPCRLHDTSRSSPFTCNSIAVPYGSCCKHVSARLPDRNFLLSSQ